MDRLLLDTHAIVWWMNGSEKLTVPARFAISQASAVFVSAATAWEIATKFRLNKLQEAQHLALNFRSEIAKESFHELPITVAAGIAAGALPGDHRDPFDRMLIAQALEEDLTLVSNETAFDRFGVKRLW
jgi:PIN domain nuclease of toxin-antitoxin system